MLLLYLVLPYRLMLLGSDYGGGSVEVTLHDYASFRMRRRTPALPCATGPPRHRDRRASASYTSPG